MSAKLYARRLSTETEAIRRRQRRARPNRQKCDFARPEAETRNIVEVEILQFVRSDDFLGF
jgi:hypothetical protein